MSKPIAVLISDVHYNLTTLPVADAAVRQAVIKANLLGVPLVIPGDLHDTKAQHRAECQEAMINTLSLCSTKPIILVGNHDRRNEKSPEHSLHFLDFITAIIDRPIDFRLGDVDCTFIPYQHDAKDFINHIKQSSPLVICHQGIIGADMGHYVQDKSAITKEDVSNHRVISGHYHSRQDIKCGRPRRGAVGLFSYVGNPYSLSFGEANDPEKGYQILMDDGHLQFVPTNLRRHWVFEFSYQYLCELQRQGRTTDWSHVGPADLIWLKISGTPSELSFINKESFGQKLFGHSNYRLEKITIGAQQLRIEPNQGPAELMDALVDKTESDDSERSELKRLWRDV